MKQGKEYETTLLGRLLSVSCLARLDGGSAEFFDRPTRLSQPEVDNTESMIYQVLHGFFFSIFVKIAAI